MSGSLSRSERAGVRVLKLLEALQTTTLDSSITHWLYDNP